MNIIEVLKSTLSTLKANKLRTILTMLGIIIGIASVITMWSISDGGRENILGNLKKIGYGKFSIDVDSGKKNFKYKDYFTLDTIKILEESKKFKQVSIYQNKFLLIKKDSEELNSQVTITTPSYESISPVEILYGRLFLPFEYSNNERVVILDNISARKLFFTSKEALGKYIEISKDKKKVGFKYKVVGVYKNPFEVFSSVIGADELPIFIRMPYKTYNETFDSEDDIFSSILVEAKDKQDLGEAMKEAKEFLEFQNNTQNIYITNALSTQIESFDQILTTLSIFFTLAASISLFVGGIGVMNIMLVTIVERTKEIGIRKALGARNKDILKQFLLESILLTLLGGMIGITLGIIISLIVGKIVSIPPIFSLNSILISISISIIVGITFGVAPAKKAANLNPIDALRTE